MRPGLSAARQEGYNPGTACNPADDIPGGTPGAGRTA